MLRDLNKAFFACTMSHVFIGLLSV